MFCLRASRLQSSALCFRASKSRACGEFGGCSKQGEHGEHGEHGGYSKRDNKSAAFKSLAFAFGVPRVGRLCADVDMRARDLQR